MLNLYGETAPKSKINKRSFFYSVKKCHHETKKSVNGVSRHSKIRNFDPRHKKRNMRLVKILASLKQI